MTLDKLIADLNDDSKYRFHLAKPDSQDKNPLQALTQSKEEWLGWQVCKGENKDRFTTDGIVSFAQISGNFFLFGGVFRINDRSGKEYVVEYDDKHDKLIGHLVIEYTGDDTHATIFSPEYIFQHSIVIGVFEGLYTLPALDSRIDLNLDETAGYLFFRDQMVKLIQEVSGFDTAKADELRKIMGMKHVTKLEPLKREFLIGAAKRGFKSETAEEVWWFLFDSSAHVRLRENVSA